MTTNGVGAVACGEALHELACKIFHLLRFISCHNIAYSSSDAVEQLELTGQAGLYST